MNKIITIALALLLAACASSSGFNRDYLRSSLEKDKPEVTDDEIRKALEASAQLPKPFKLAVYTRLHTYNVNWSEEDKNELEILEKNLRAAGVVSDVVYLNSSMIEGESHAAIRLAAAHTGSDAVLIVHGAGTIDRYNNVLGASYILLVTPLFVPGTVTDGLFMLGASLWDVRNQYLYLSAEAEAEATKTAPGFLLDDKAVLDEAKSKSVRLLRKELEYRLMSMK